MRIQRLGGANADLKKKKLGGAETRFNRSRDELNKYRINTVGTSK
jgi:hypothetical protein